MATCSKNQLFADACENGFIGLTEELRKALELQLLCNLSTGGGGGGGGGTWGSITGTLSNQTDLQTALNAKLSLSGGTLTGALLFTDNLFDIGAAGATRPRRGYFGTEVVSPLFTGALTGNVTGSASLNVLKAGDTMTGALLFSLDNTVDIGASLATRPRRGYFGTEVVSPLFTGALTGNVTGSASLNLLLTGGTLTGDLLFSLDNTLDIGASLATRPRRGYFGTEVVSPLFTGSLTGAASLNLLLTGGTLTGNLLFTDDTLDIGATGATRPRTGYFGTQLNIQKGAIGATPTDGLLLTNATAAAAGAQQYSTAIRLTGQGWKTDTGGASQATDWRIYNQPVQGAANPTSNLLIQFSVNGGAFATAFTLGSAGLLTAQNSVLAVADLRAGSGSSIYWNGRSLMKSPSDGVISLLNQASTDFGRLNFGGTTSSFPAIKRSAALLQARLADDSAFTEVECSNIITNNAAAAVSTNTTLTDFAAAALGTLANAPTAGNPASGSP